MILYLTFNDAPEGIYSSQVIDVVNFMRAECNAPVKLISFISLRGFVANRKKIKDQQHGALVIPMIPGVKRWRLNTTILNIICKTLRPHAIIGRSVLATILALEAKEKNLIQKVIYDGRGAIASEWKEYNVISDQRMLEEVSTLERKAVMESDIRIAVSKKLVEYWEKNYSYESMEHVVIPCTINKFFENLNSPFSTLQSQDRGISGGDILFVYSGSVAGWQSLKLLQSFLEPLLVKDKKNKILFLSEKHEEIIKLQNKYPEQVFQKQVSVSEVFKYISPGDYGLLIREQSETNYVASPVKFAEYLACGLKVIISENLGDYTELVTANQLGNIAGQPNNYNKVTLEQKKELRKFALEKFSKRAHLHTYKQLLEKINSN